MSIRPMGMHRQPNSWTKRRVTTSRMSTLHNIDLGGANSQFDASSPRFAPSSSLSSSLHSVSALAVAWDFHCHTMARLCKC